MGKDKRTALPPVSPEFAELHPELVRRTGGGGWAWKCAYCKMFASSETADGKYVCYRHGGTRLAAIDPVEGERVRKNRERRAVEREAEALASAGGDSGQPDEGNLEEEEVQEVRPAKAPRPSGRPINDSLGFYASSTLKVDELVQQYKQQKLHPDSTDDDMLYLRAYLDVMKTLTPEVEELRALLKTLIEELNTILSARIEVEKGVRMSAQDFLENLDQLKGVEIFVKDVKYVYDSTLSFTRDMERRHANLVRLADVRAATRVKNSTAQQLDVFALFMRRLQVMLQEMMPPEMFNAVQERVKKDFREVPRAVVVGAGQKPN